MNNIKDKAIKTADGIPFFSEERYWGKAPKEVFERAINVLEEKGFEAFEKEYRGQFDFTLEDNRADWRFPIEVSKNHTVLDIGAGMGRISLPLAKVAGKVMAVDQTFLRMKFLKIMAGKLNLPNLETYVGDIFTLPFEPESFDLIVMNGVLEWVGATDRFADPREAQLESLKICKKLLKPGGHLYIGIENRWAIAYLRAIDHSGLRFTSYMPRFLADWYTRLRKGHPYDTYTYGQSGYENLLKEAGFANNDFYLVYPGYNRPRVLIPYEKLNIFEYVISKLMVESNFKRKAVKMLSRLPIFLKLYRKLFFSFDIIATK